MAGNVFSNIKTAIKDGAKTAISEAGTNVSEGMKERLMAAGHAGTGELLDSIRCEITENNDEVSASVNMVDYGEFIEHGTGAAHGVENGRQGYWRYQDREGNWHTTDGMNADPFIEPAVSDTMTNLSAVISEQVRVSVAEAMRGGR